MALYVFVCSEETELIIYQYFHVLRNFIVGGDAKLRETTNYTKRLIKTSATGTL